MCVLSILKTHKVYSTTLKTDDVLVNSMIIIIITGVSASSLLPGASIILLSLVTTFSIK